MVGDAMRSNRECKMSRVCMLPESDGVSRSDVTGTFLVSDIFLELYTMW